MGAGIVAAERSPELDVLLAKQALHELNAAYCRAMDRADATALAALFHPGAIVNGGMFNGDAAHFSQAGPAWLREHATLVFHSVTNEFFVVEGDVASGESYLLAFLTMRTEGGNRDVITGGRYLDRYERRNGQWRFTQRTFVMDCNLNQASTGIYDDALNPPGQYRGAFGPNDPSDRFWRR
jgi:SnoaL-like protein